MQEYQGQPCLVCGQVFAESDDIVTCPECGTPYHRACWKETGHCVNTELHAAGGSWQIRRKEAIAEEFSAAKKAEEAQQQAERERGEQPQMFNGGLYDGVRLNPEDPCIGLDPVENLGDEERGATMYEVAEFVRSNRFYYLPLFHFMKKTGRKFSLNLLCLLFPEFYFANRKMWLLSIFTMLINIVLNIPAAIVYFSDYMNISIPWADVTTDGFQQIYGFSGILWMGLKTLLCLFANYLYLRFSVRRVSAIKRSAATETEAMTVIRGAGGTSLVNVVLALVIKGTLLFLMMAALLMLR